MRTAFYFDEDVAYNRPFTARPDVDVMRAIVAAVPSHRLHVYILRGTLDYRVFQTRDRLDAIVDHLLGIRQPAWTSFTPASLRSALRNHSVTAFVVRGLLAKDSRSIDGALRESSGYLGAIQVQPGELSWLLYDSSLPPLYRILGEELRVIYYDYQVQVEDDRDHAQFDEWRQSGIFAAVIWEDIGLQGTFFDPYATVDHARTTGESEELVSDQLARIVDEIMLRVAKIDPRLVRQLHGALKSFDTLNTVDSLAHVSLSCRRLLERLADALFPARHEKVDGREVGQAQYRNRLWAYIRENIESRTQREILLTTLADVGSRVDSLDTVANKGLHADLSATEVQRLLIALITLIYDILTLVEPPINTPEAPYNDYARRVIRDMLRRGDEEDPDQ